MNPVTPAPEIEKSTEQPSLVRGLGLLDSVLLLVSGIIGSSIFLTAKDIAGPLPNTKLFFLVWVLGGAISLCACGLCGTWLDVSRLRRSIHLPARSVW